MVVPEIVADEEIAGRTGMYLITTTPEPPAPPGGFTTSPATGEMSSKPEPPPPLPVETKPATPPEEIALVPFPPPPVPPNPPATASAPIPPPPPPAKKAEPPDTWPIPKAIETTSEIIEEAFPIPPSPPRVLEPFPSGKVFDDTYSLASNDGLLPAPPAPPPPPAAQKSVLAEVPEFGSATPDAPPNANSIPLTVVIPSRVFCVDVTAVPAV